MSENYKEISNFIWDTCNTTLRDTFERHEYGEIILPFTVLRRLDGVLEDKKDETVEVYEKFKDKTKDPTPIILNKINKKFCNKSKYDLLRLQEDSQNIRINFDDYINGFSDNVFNIIKNFQIGDYIQRLEDEDLLYKYISNFSKIDLHPSKVSNHTMGLIFEEILRKYSEESNKTSGEHYTPRDVVQLLVSLVFSGEKENLDKEGIIRSLYDPCCGTGGMLTIGSDYVSKNISEKVEFRLLGQEVNPRTHSTCQSDMLILGRNPDDIVQGSTLSKDGYKDEKFDYMISNPPYGKNWSSEKQKTDFNQELSDPNGRFHVGTPTIRDGQLLFFQHLISKMEPSGSRIGIVTNGSPLFNGDSGEGESEIRKWIVENDWVETIIKLPNQLFFNTPITTFIWVLTNKKQNKRKGTIQLIDCSEMFNPLDVSLNKKRKEISEKHRKEILELYLKEEGNENKKIIEGKDFLYKRIKIEHPLYENGKIVKTSKGISKSDGSIQDYDRVLPDTDVREYFQKKYSNHLPDCWVEESKNKIGCEINFEKYFYQKTPIKTSYDLSQKIKEVELFFSEEQLKTEEDITEITSKLNSTKKSKNPRKKTNVFLGNIPKNWETERLRFLCEIFPSNVDKVINENETPVKLCNYLHVYNNDFLNNQTEFDLGTCNEKEFTKFQLKKEDILITKDSEVPEDIGVPSLVTENLDGVICGYHLYLLRPKEILGKYLFYFLQTKSTRDYFEVFSNGVTRWGLTKVSLSNLVVPIPPVDEQKNICKFMDRFTNVKDLSRIVEKKRSKLLEELEDSYSSELFVGDFKSITNFRNE
tara:strand:+ start:60 stop:2495 length:2436 start_codon:yes stop_codon:yes gene_type:complete